MEGDPPPSTVEHPTDYSAGANGPNDGDSERNEAPSFLEESDLVRIKSLDVLATVEHIGGETSSEEESSSEDESDPDLPADNVISAGRRLRNMFDPGRMLARIEDKARVLEKRADFLSNGEPDDNSDADGDDEDEEGATEEDADEPEVPEGSCLLARIDNGEDVVRPVADLQVLDRVLAPGQMVLSAVPGDKNVQTGTIHALKKTLIVRRMAGWDPNDPESNNEPFEVPAERISFFGDVRNDCYVVSRNWLGVVEFFSVEVFVDFPDGSIAVVPGHPDRLYPDDNRFPSRPNPDAEGYFFPGMKVKASSRYWRDATWLRGKYRKQRSGTVRSMKTTTVGVQWIAARQNLPPTSGDAPGPPPDVVAYSDVRRLDAYRSIWWRAGDYALLHSEDVKEEDQWVEHMPSLPNPSTRDDRLSSRPRSTRRNTSRGNGRLIAAQRRNRELSSSEDSESQSLSSLPQDPNAVVQILETRTTATVEWQNGVIEEGIPSVSLRVNEHPGASDFWPGAMVSRTTESLEADVSAAEEQNQTAQSTRARLTNPHDAGGEGGENVAEPKPKPLSLGMVIRVDLEERTAVVRWVKAGSREYCEEEEEYSVYDLVARMEYDMHLGDTVLLVGEEGSVSDDPNAEPRWIGQITHKGIGDMEVTWLDGGKSRIYPDQVIVVGEEDESDPGSSSEDDEGGDFEDGAVNVPRPQPAIPSLHGVFDPALRDNWGLDESSSMEDAVHHELEVVFRNAASLSRAVFSSAINVNEAFEHYEEAVIHSESMLPTPGERSTESSSRIMEFVHGVAIRIVTRCVQDMDKSERNSEMDGRDWPHQSWNELKIRLQHVLLMYLEEKGFQIPAPGQPVDVLLPNEEMSPQSPGDSDMKDALSTGEEVAPMDVEEAEEPLAASFEVVESFKNHHYANRSSSVTGQPRMPGFANVVRKEWTRLRKNLPSGIYVHGSEQQQDLMRVAIVGPRDTPYENVLFIFDILLPIMYPTEPPKVFFHSFGRRLNPNLYEDGKVCLSILGTWDGDDVEQWDPRNSNVLRVLLSLQAMVFVEEPYYNEAGYQKQVGTIEGLTNSRTYNESTLLLCQRHMIQSIRGGTPEDFVELQKKHYARDGQKLIKRLKALYAEVSASTDSEKQGSGSYTSRGFKKSLMEIVPRVERELAALNQ